MTGWFIYMPVSSDLLLFTVMLLKLKATQPTFNCMHSPYFTSSHLSNRNSETTIIFFCHNHKKDRCIYVITKSKTFILVNGVVIGRVYNYVIVEMYGDSTDFFRPSASWFSKYFKKNSDTILSS